MATLELSPGNSLYFEYTPPAKDGANTYVFVNPISGDVSLWNALIIPALQKQGHGTLAYNFRGQAISTFSEGTDLTEQLIVSDLRAILDHCQPPNAVLVGSPSAGFMQPRHTWAVPMSKAWCWSTRCGGSRSGSTG